MKKKIEKCKSSIKWNLINSFLAGALLFLGSISNGEITFEAIYYSIIISLIVAVTKFKDYWSTQETSVNHLFNFI